ncbi:MAG: aldehyde ferredoxin oxidoreductase N-terminal domain-containing protein [Candidatus Aenigmatarchaeota archaeon]
MNDNFGYEGRILRVDLTKEKVIIETPNELFYRTYIGGGALACYYLLRELKPRIDPLSPDNKIVFATSVISGIPAPGISRLIIASKSPLTNGYGQSEAGGFFTPELKFAGFDAIIVEGKSDSPIYLFIKNGEVEFREARHLWGKTTLESHKAIQEELKDKAVRIINIGPAGENLVRYAGIANDIVHYHGRTGLGAVMGSKNLKAIAVRGQKK